MSGVRNYLTAALVLAGLSAGGCFYGPPHSHVVVGHPGPVVLFHYWYYPDVGVYYDYENEIYFYLRSGTWISVKTLPPTIVLSRDRYVILEVDTDKPYRYHERHRVQHPPGGPIKRVAPGQRPKGGKKVIVKEGPQPKEKIKNKPGAKSKLETKPKPEPKSKPKAAPRGKGKGRGGSR